ncbi:MAG: MFS transporter [Betaproteobacteria bacterium]|nr:MFS transporter [Betaproteobacteria bacterium]
MPRLPSHLNYFLASFAWNYGLGMTWLVVPLYAYSTGLSGAEIGILFSLPSVAQLAINLVCGAYVDRFGGKRIMLASSALLAMGAAAMPLAGNFWSLLLAQCFLMLAHATFWPANWSIAAELPGGRGAQAGRLNAVTNLGQILGNGSCGLILAFGGFNVTYSVLAATAVLALALGVGTPQLLRTAPPGRPLFGNYAVLLRVPVLYYGILCAYVAALPYSLVMSFYPLLLKQFGFGAEASGVLLALRAVGGIGAGLAVARFVHTGPASLWPVVAGLVVALAVCLQPLVSHWSAVGAFLFALGMGSSVMIIYFQVTIAEAVPPEMRGSAMALGGLGWGLSHLSTPLLMGLVADQYGVIAGFYLLGAIALVNVALISWLRRWAFSGTRLKTGKTA